MDFVIALDLLRVVVIGELYAVSLADVLVAVLVSSSFVVCVVAVIANERGDVIGCSGVAVVCKVNEIVLPVAVVKVASDRLTTGSAFGEVGEVSKAVVNVLSPPILDEFVSEDIVALERCAVDVKIYDNAGEHIVTVVVSRDVVVTVLVFVTVIIVDLLLDVAGVTVVVAFGSAVVLDGLEFGARSGSGLGFGLGLGFGSGLGSGFGLGGSVHFLNNFKFGFSSAAHFPKL